MKDFFDPDEQRRHIESAFSIEPDSNEIEIGTKLDGTPLRIPVSDFDRHAMFAGTTGGGKTKCFQRVFQELALHTNSAQVLLDPMGNTYHFLKRWAYSEGLDERVVLIDPAEQRLVCGVNPVAPWPSNHLLQAALSWEAVRIAMDEVESQKMPLLSQWMCNGLYAVITTGLTICEAPHIVDFEDDGFRNAVIPRMSDRSVQKDFERLEMIVQKQAQLMAQREWWQQAGAAHRRLQNYARNESLRLMLGTTQRVVDWDAVLDERKLVLVNLSGVRNPRQRILTDEDSRLFGLQLVNELIQVCWRRQEVAGDKAPPCYAFLDECQRYVSPSLARILAEGRQFNLRLILAFRVMDELMDERNESSRFMRLVSSCPQLKVVFGGLGWRATSELAEDLYAHHVDLKEEKDRIETIYQTSHVEEVESSASASSRSDSKSMRLDGIFSPVIGEVAGWSEVVQRGRMVVPDDPKKQMTGRTFWTFDEQLAKATARLKNQPTQHATITSGIDHPVEFRVADVLEPPVTYEHALNIDLDVMRSLPFYSEPKLIEEEIADRQSDLLAISRSAPSGLLPEHRVEPEIDPDEDDSTTKD